jgi:hypothetical protein
MITEGKYSVWFRTPIGDGAGIVEFGPNGELSGGDTTFSYIGNWEQDGERFKAAISAKRMTPGPPGVFGMDEIDTSWRATPMVEGPPHVLALQSNRRV